MSVKIRLRRTGGNKEVSFRVVAADSRSPRDGRHLEVLGWYDPKKKGHNFELNIERIEHWRKHGAVVSVTVMSLLKRLRKETKPAA